MLFAVLLLLLLLFVVCLVVCLFVLFVVVAVAVVDVVVSVVIIVADRSQLLLTEAVPCSSDCRAHHFLWWISTRAHETFMQRA